MSTFRTLVINHHDSIGTPYTTRVMTDFPKAAIDDFLPRAVALYESLDMGVVSVVEVEEHHHQRMIERAGGPGAGVGPGRAHGGPPGVRVFGAVAIRGFRRTLVRPAVMLGVVAVLIAADLTMDIRTEIHMAHQDALIKATGYELGARDAKPSARELEAIDWPHTANNAE